MQTNVLYTAAPNLCSVCVDDVRQGECTGRLFHYYSEQPVAFRNRSELLSCIDDVCDQAGYPQAAQQMRSFRRSQPEAPVKKEVECRMSKEELNGQKGRMATFVVHVMHRQNATWQGTVVWAEKNQKASFRSALELIKLMDGAVEESLPDLEHETEETHDAFVQE